jgi:hypothetical protein
MRRLSRWLVSMMSFGKLTRRLNILRASGAIGDYRIIDLGDQFKVQVSPGDSLMAGVELQWFVAEMLGSDIKPEQILVESAELRPAKILLH